MPLEYNERRAQERQFREEHGPEFYAMMLNDPSSRKVCTGCEFRKPYMDYRKEPTRRDGFQARCKSCEAAVRTKQYRRRVYGLSEVDYLAMKQLQGCRCAICGTHEDERPLVVDHCHQTGKVRGLLCQPCNGALGILGDNADRLLSAICYLAQSSGYTVLDLETSVIQYLDVAI